MFEDAYNGQRVWISGVTGFKGAWLAQWLLDLGAEVHGFSLPPPTQPSLFELLGLEEKIHFQEGDVRSLAEVKQSLVEARPDYVFHLAAQPLVRFSYDEPLETWQSNVMGTLHVMEALRGIEKSCAAVMVTTDKCYENQEWLHSYREVDPLGGHDPYSSSKAGAEIAISAWRRSFFHDSPVRLASARAGNVIGGGDFALDRIVPDCVRALSEGGAIPVRNRVSTRPWQHVLDPLSGYLQLAVALMRSIDGDRVPVDGAFNFGPTQDSNRTVEELVKEVLRHWPGDWVDRSDPAAVHEATLLNLSIDKAFHQLSWQPVWGFEEAVGQTIRWYRGRHQEEDPLHLTQQQIRDFEHAAHSNGRVWARPPSDPSE